MLAIVRRKLFCFPFSYPKIISTRIIRATVLFVVLYGCETWLLTLNEKHTLNVFQTGVLRGIFGVRRDGVKWEWRRLHNEELYDLCSSPNIVRVIKTKDGWNM